MKINHIYKGNCLTVLKTFKDESIDCVITSPPYWALRDYGVEGQLGLESTFQEYITKLCDIFDEVKRVLKKTGTCWVNLGDTYSGNKEGKTDNKVSSYLKDNSQGIHKKATITEKCLCQIPSRFAIEMTNRGWILRNEIIWHKPNCMPSSVKDRFTVDFEKIFFFVKSKKYWFETQYEHNESRGLRWGKFTNPKYNKLKGGSAKGRDGMTREEYAERYKNRNKRAVWKINTKPFSEAHFAVYPEALIETPIKAGCPQFICKKCGKAKYPIYKNTKKQHSIGATSGLYHKERNFKGDNTVRNMTKQIGLTDCGCKAGFEAGIVLDPFFGAGTTGLVAQNLNRSWIGIELNKEYIKIANNRLKQKPML